MCISLFSVLHVNEVDDMLSEGEKVCWKKNTIVVEMLTQ